MAVSPVQSDFSSELEAREARNRFLLENENIIHGVIRKHFKSLADQFGYDDVFQTACLCVLRESHRYDPRRAQPSTFIHLLVLSRLANYRSRETLISGRFKTKTDSPIFDFIPDRGNSFSEVEARIDIAAAVDRLPARQREVVRLAYGFDGNKPMNQREIVARTGLAKTTVSELLESAHESILSSFSV